MNKVRVFIAIVVLLPGITDISYAQNSKINSNKLLNGNLEQDSSPLKIEQRKYQENFSQEKNFASSGTSDILKTEVRKGKSILEAELSKAQLELKAETEKASKNSSEFGISPTPILNTIDSQEIESQRKLSNSIMQAEIEKSKYFIDSELFRQNNSIDYLTVPQQSIATPTININTLKIQNFSELSREIDAEAYRGKLKTVVDLPSYPNKVRGNIQSLKREENAALIHELKTQMILSKAPTDSILARSSSEMKAEIKRAKEMNQFNTSAIFSTSALFAENQILWDEWYYRFNKIAEPILENNLEMRGFPSGSNTVSITVSFDNKISVSLISGKNQKFDEAIIQSYLALHKNSKLTFPLGSKLTKVTFLIDNSHAIGGISGVSSNSLTGVHE